MTKSRDVLVIGEGLAGVSAALAAAERGRAVTVVSKGPGASALSSGALDVAPRLHLREEEASESVAANERPISLADPAGYMSLAEAEHPYALFGAEGGAMIDGALRFMLAKLGSAGLEHAPLRAEGHLVVDGTGNMRRVAAAQATQVVAGLDPTESRVGVVRPRGNLGLDTLLVAAGLRRKLENVEELEIDWPGGPGGPFLLPVELGRLLDEEDEISRFTAMVRKVAAGLDLTHLLLPPICGLERPGEVTRALARATGLAVAEILGGAASLPGLRLHAALRRALSAAGIEMSRGFVTRDEGPLAEHTGPVVLATGRFLGGGLRRAEQLEETVFGLPVFEGGRRLREQPVEILTRRSASDPQPLFRAGIRAGADLRPLDLGGKAPRKGLFAAGSILGSYDPHHDLCGAGVALLTGHMAGKRAADGEV